jgi:hypothetical protein
LDELLHALVEGVRDGEFLVEGALVEFSEAEVGSLPNCVVVCVAVFVDTHQEITIILPRPPNSWSLRVEALTGQEVEQLIPLDECSIAGVECLQLILLELLHEHAYAAHELYALGHRNELLLQVLEVPIADVGFHVHVFCILLDHVEEKLFQFWVRALEFN